VTISEDMTRKRVLGHLDEDRKLTTTEKDLAGR